jgi:hypothetical protein
MGSDGVDRGQDRLHGANAERMDEESRARQREPGLTSDMAARLEALELENRELRQAGILREVSAYFALPPGE